MVAKNDERNLRCESLLQLLKYFLHTQNLNNIQSLNRHVISFVLETVYYRELIVVLCK